MEKFKRISLVLLVLLPLAVRSLEHSALIHSVNDAPPQIDPLSGVTNNITSKLEVDPSQASNGVSGRVEGGVTGTSSASVGEPSNGLPKIESDHSRTAATNSVSSEKSTAEISEIKIEEKAVNLTINESIRSANESKPNDPSIESSVFKPTNQQTNSSVNSDSNDSIKREETPGEKLATTSGKETSSSETQPNNKSHADRSIGGISGDLSGSVTVNQKVNLTTDATNSSISIKKADNLPASSTIDETKVLDNRSTNEEDEFDEFEKEEAKKEDESSIVENDKASNKVEAGASDKAASKDNEEASSTPKSISYKHGETEAVGEDEEDDESANSSNSSANSANGNSNNNSLRNDKKESTNTTQPADDSEHEDDEEEELDEETSKKVPANQANGRARKPGERERASLNKLQAFLQSTVEQALKSALPELVKSGYETNLSPSCTNSFLAVSRGLQGTRQWAYKMLDSSGKPPSGILEGTLTDFGAFEQCLTVDTRLEQPEENNHFTGKYCILDVKPAFDVDIPLGSQPPAGIRNDSVLWAPSLQIFWSRNSLLSFRYGLCVPSVCSDQDLQTLAAYFFKPTGMVAEVGFCQLNTEQHADTLQILIIFALSVILLTVFIGSVLEVSLKRLDKQQLLTSNKKSLVDFLICFSIIKNTRRLLNIKNTRNPTHNSQLKHLDAVRFLSTCWIIMGHTYFYTDFVHYHHFRSLAHFKFLDDNFWFMPIANFTLSVETYFFISGLLVVYSSWSKLKSSNGKINILEFLVHRVWRIWPPYLVVIACTLILPLFGSGPLWPESVKSTANVCRKSWFYNILFINNFQKPNEVCLFHSWFLAANIQFHLMAVPLLFVLYKYPKLFFGICGVAIMTCIGWVFNYAQVNDLTIPAVIADDVFVDFDQNILTLYILPLYHLGSYLLGMILGFILITKTPKVLPGKLQITFWSLSLVMLAIVIFLPHHSFQGEPTSLLFSSFYLSLHRIVWSLAFGWIVYACSTGQGYFINSILSYEAFTALSSLSYLAYLVHPILMLYHTGMVRERVQLSHYQLLNTFLARVILAFSSAYILYVVVELPFANIEKYIFPAAARRRQKAAIEQADGKKAQPNNLDGLESNAGSNTKSNHFYQFNQQAPNNPAYFSHTIGGPYPNKGAHQLSSPYHQLANQKKVITDYYSASMSRQFNQTNASNFKEKHHLNLGNQRRTDRQFVERQSNEKHLTDRQLIDKRQALDRQQHLNRLGKHYPYLLNEQDKKYLLYRQGPINQYYFYSGSSRTNATGQPQQSNFNQHPTDRSKELSNLKGSKENSEQRILLDEPESHVEPGKVVSTVIAESTTCSLTIGSLNGSSLESNEGLQCKQLTTTNDESTADTQLTSATLSSNTLSESVTVDSETNQAASEQSETELCERC